MSRRLLAVLTAALLALGVPSFAHASEMAWPSAEATSTAAATPVASPQPFSYSQLRSAIHGRTVRQADLYPQRGTAVMVLTDGRRVVAEYPLGDTTLAAELADAGARVSVYNPTPESGQATVRVVNTGGRTSRLTLVATLLPSLLLLGLFVFMMLRMRGGGMGALGKPQRISRAKIDDGNIPQVRFKDVAGVEECVDSLRDLLRFLEQPEAFQALGAVLPRGMIFHGPPGTGKTLMAKALAGEAGVPFYSVSGSDFVEMFVGRGSARVRQLFADARQHDAAVIFFDEFDALGKRRSGSAGGNDEREQTLNQLLVEMDGFEANSRIICIAATNRIDTLDPAVLRPGRFGEQLLVDLPSEEGRRQILAVHARSKPFAPDVDLDRLAHITYGSSGADLADMLNRAAILAAKAGRDQIAQADIEDGYLDSIAGPRKRSAVLADGEREVVAVHEAGHVLTAELCPAVEKAMRVSIQQRGRAGGMAVYGRTDRMLQDQQYLHEKLIGVLGGRAAEFVTRGVITSGASNDLQQANAMARHAVEELGFSTRAGQLVSSRGGESMRVSEQTVAVIDDEIRRLVDDAYQDAIRLLQAHRDEFERLAAALLEHEDLDRPEIVAVFAGVADEPRATPQRAVASPQPALARSPLPAPVTPRRRGERARARLAAILLRERVSSPGYTAVSTPDE